MGARYDCMLERREKILRKTIESERIPKKTIDMGRYKEYTYMYIQHIHKSIETKVYEIFYLICTQSRTYSIQTKD